MSIPRKSILNAIDRINKESNLIDKSTKDFLTGWLSDGLKGPDQLLKQEINNQRSK